MRKIDDVIWRKAAHRHREILRPLIEPYLEQRSRGDKDPVLDFLFEYYAFRPSSLMKWSPGSGVVLSGNLNALQIDKRFLRQEPDGFAVSYDAFPVKRLSGLQWTLNVLKATANSKPSFGCHGLHEWAMVYDTTDVRHRQFPLRLGATATNQVVKDSKLICTHFDAFRFFTPAAAPLNQRELNREAVIDTEQPGCLHSNMDLYKWSSKFFPWISSDLIRESFLLALDIRKVDMRASPYDLSSLGIAPIKIECDTGRAEYRRHQSKFYSRSEGIRADLIDAVQVLLQAVTKNAEGGCVSFQKGRNSR